MPKLRTINGIDFSITDMDERNKIRDNLNLMEKLTLIANVYVLGQGIGSQAVWYLNDEVGSLINHSDTPNVKVRSFIHSPENKIGDENRLEVSVVWPTSDIAEKQVIMMDKLMGFTEQRGFRSTRLHAFYDVPTEYFTQQLALLRSKMPNLDIE